MEGTIKTWLRYFLYATLLKIFVQFGRIVLAERLTKLMTKRQIFTCVDLEDK